MTISKKKTVFGWLLKALALAILLFGLPFYFGYGNPLPFINQDYTSMDNLWLSIFPIMFIGLILSFWKSKIGGLMISIPLILGLIVTLIIEHEIIWFMFVPLIVGLLFVYNSSIKNTENID